MNLACPHCGETVDMHHTTVSIFERQRSEDGDGKVFTFQGIHMTEQPLPENKMPGRRNAVKLRFECWNCQKGSVLFIQQHKGSTIIEWEYPADKPVVLDE